MTSKELKMLRKQLGLTQAQLGAEVGVDANTVARWERGEARVSVAVAKLVRLMAAGKTSSSVTASTGLARDSYHNAILSGLGGHLDPDLFEACAADLLREIYPSLTPVRGGSDHGFDGAIASGNEKPFPLITTTGTDARANLRRNLKQAGARGDKPTMAVFATSRHLTPRTRDELEVIATALGVRSLQIHDQDWFANALYQDAAWTTKLLNITGRPSALSIMPLTARPLIGDEVIGRQSELQALRSNNRDMTVVAGPGAGKTFLLRALAREGRALFLIDTDREAIADAVRSQRPLAIIVDDAHLMPGTLLSLRQLRKEIGAEFHVIAVTWPADASDIRTQLDMPSDAVLELPDIDADTMVEIVKSVGVKGPNELIHSIVRQADGRPGLAATLAQLCLRGDAQHVWSGKSLTDDLLPILTKLAGENPAPLLACFGLAGGRGFAPAVVAHYLGKPLDEISNVLGRLGTAGVIRQTAHGNSISVWPEQFRWTLVRDIFFGGRLGSIPHEPLMEQASDTEQSIMTLIGARSRGAQIPTLQDLVDQADSERLWGAYASLGTTEAKHVVQARPEIVAKIASILLDACPDDVLPILLDAAVGDDRQLHSNPDHPLRRLKDWITTPSDVHSVRLERSEALVVATDRWWRTRSVDEERFGNVAIQALAIAFDPNWRSGESDPGQGRTFTFHFGSIDEEDAKSLLHLWTERKSLLKLGNHSNWANLIALVHEWSYSPPNVRLSDSLQTMRNRVGEQILRDLSTSAQEHLGVQHQVVTLARQLKYKLNTTIDSEFEILFPSREAPEKWREQHQQWYRAAQALAPAWASQGPDAAATKILRIEAEARSAGINWPRLTPALFETISECISEPRIWFEALCAAKVPADLVRPFVRKIATSSHKDTDLVLHACLKSESYSFIGVEIALTTPSMSPEIVFSAIKRADVHPHLIETVSLRDELAPATLERLMTAGSVPVALAAAVGEWNVAKHSSRAIRLRDVWRSAILKSAHATKFSDHVDYWLAEIFKENSTLAFDWLVELNETSERYLEYSLSELSKKALTGIDKTQRVALVGELRAESALAYLAKAVVGIDIDAYKALLARGDLTRHHLTPLEGLPSLEWRSKTVAALDAGYSKAAILNATRPKGWTWSGPRSAMWKERKSAFDMFANDDDARIAAIARDGAEGLARQIQEALEQERIEAVRGR